MCSRLYPTEAINSVQTRLKLSKNKLKVKLYIYSLLFEEPIIHFGWIFGSSKTSSLLLENEELLSEKIITISTEFNSLEENYRWLLEDKYKIKSEELLKLGIKYSYEDYIKMEIFSNSKMSLKRRLAHCEEVFQKVLDTKPKILKIDAKKAVEMFKSSFIETCNIYMEKLDSRSNQYLNHLIEIVDSGTLFEPIWTEYIIKRKLGINKLPPNIVNLLNKLVHVSYFLAGATVQKSQIGTDILLFDDFNYRLRYTDRIFNPTVFEEILKFHEFRVDSILSLEIDELKELRKSHLVKSLRRKLLTLIANSIDIEKMENIKIEFNESLDDLKKVIMQTYVEKLEEEMKSAKLLRKVKNGLLFAKGFLLALVHWSPPLEAVIDVFVDKCIDVYIHSKIPFTTFFTEIYPKKLAESKTSRQKRI